MQSNLAQPDALDELLAGLFDPGLTHEQQLSLNDVLAGSAMARKRYIRYVTLHAVLQSELQWQDLSMLRALRERVERGAADLSETSVFPAVYVGDASDTEYGQSALDAAPPALPSDSIAPPRPWYLARGPLTLATAAVVAMATGVFFTVVNKPVTPTVAVAPVVVKSPIDIAVTPPPVVEEPAVATITGGWQARWRDDAVRAVGLRVPVGRSMVLTSGFAELTFVGGARVVVEGPADFTVESARLTNLRSGRLTATVPGGDFVVRSPSATVTDLGTEFGVDVAADGATRVEVFNGKVRAASITAAPDATLAGVVSAGQAADVSTTAVRIDPLGISPQRFVRQLTSDSNRLDVVDLINGGDGTSGRRGIAIDALGRAGSLTSVGRVTGDAQYHRAEGVPFVDGCFVPSAVGGAMPVTSTLQTFAFPANAGVAYNHIWTGGQILPVGADTRPGTVLGDVDYAQPGHALVFMSGNRGVTVDLAVARRLYPGRTLDRFRCTVGNGDVVANVNSKTDAYVMLDGRGTFEQRGFDKGHSFAVDVPIGAGDRFLTLAITDGGDGIGNDGVLWGDPHIELK